jgi:signal transduction histidine kinase/FixJ family two-component response regulator
MSTSRPVDRPRPLVLVVDDSATYRAAIRQALQQAGYDVAVASDGEGGLQAAARLRPDVLVVDRVLPDMDGTAIIRNVRFDATLRRTPCLLITADEDPSVEFTALETGADAYVRKGDDLGVLLARVATLRRDAPSPRQPLEASSKRRLVVVASPGAAHVADAVSPPSNEYDVLRVADAERAIAALAAGPVACAVVVMQNRDEAVPVIRQLRAAAPAARLPILVMQESDSPADAFAVLTAGADDFVTRAQPALYGARLHALIRRKEAEQEDRRVTESLLRHEADAAAASMRAEIAERESEFKERFLAVMSHELRTPLNAILGFTQLLERGVGGGLNETQRRHVGGIVRSAEHLLALVNDVLDLSKVRAGKLTIRRVPVPLHENAETARLTVRPLAVSRGIALLVNVPASLPAVWGDPVRIQQILQNLLSNGVKFTPPGGSVALTASGEGAAVRLAIADTGVGIKPEDFPRLFRDFERLEHGQSQQADGTGLGLSLTRHLVDLHGGRIEVASEVGIGSTFTVWLPIAAAEALG